MSRSLMSEGARVWHVPDGFIPEESSGELESHEAICVLNTSTQEARLSISFYFEDREPVREVEVIVGPERTRHLRTDRIEGAGIPRGVPYAIPLESNVPVTVQCSRMDTSQPALSLMSAMAYPVES